MAWNFLIISKHGRLAYRQLWNCDININAVKN